VIFLHGFPDSAYLWDDTLKSSLGQSAKLIALDLPGCGGSDSLAKYGADELLNAIAEAIVLLRQQYGHSLTEKVTVDSRPRCILVGHDWGGIITSRIAAEAPGLVDRAIIMNSTHVSRGTIVSGISSRD